MDECKVFLVDIVMVCLCCQEVIELSYVVVCVCDGCVVFEDVIVGGQFIVEVVEVVFEEVEVEEFE